MIVEITKKVEVDVKWLQIICPFHYANDIEINGIQFEDDDSEIIGLPLFENGEWNVKIDIDNGTIQDWEIGKSVSIYSKLRDEGNYFVMDGDYNEIAVIKQNYVPDCLGEYGDYLILSIDENGKVENFKFNIDDFHNNH